MKELVGKPKGRFSCEEAHMIVIIIMNEDRILQSCLCHYLISDLILGMQSSFFLGMQSGI